MALAMGSIAVCGTRAKRTVEPSEARPVTMPGGSEALRSRCMASAVGRDGC